MMTPSRAASEIADLFGPSLIEDGFIRSGLNFYRYGAESVLLINIQSGSLWLGPYINLGVYYFRFGAMNRPEIADCHLQTRLISVVPNPLRQEELLQLTNDIPQHERYAELLEMMRRWGVPWLEGVSTFDSARTFLPGSTKAAHIAPIARDDLMPSDAKDW